MVVERACKASVKCGMLLVESACMSSESRGIDVDQLSPSMSEYVAVRTRLRACLQARTSSMSKCVVMMVLKGIRKSQAVFLLGGQENPASGSPEAGRSEVAVSSSVSDVVEAAAEKYH